MAQTKTQDEPVAKVEPAAGSDVASLREQVEALTEAVRRLSEAGPKLQVAVPAEDRLTRAIARGLKRPGDQAQRRFVRDLRDPKAAEEGFQWDDIVEIVGDGEHVKSIREHAGLPKDEPILGVVRNYMYTRRDGVRKYQVQVRGLGRDGFLETELSLVESA